ncbi:MAG: hypothetical protein AB7O56_12150 [Bauldia sp.]
MILSKRAISVIRRRFRPDQWPAAFHKGLRRHGWRADFVADWEPCDLLVLWGVHQDLIARQQAHGGEVCILERGYIGNRFAWTSVSFGGELNGRAEFRGVSDDASRFQKHFSGLMQPWRHGGDYALLIGQVPGDASLRPVHGHLDAWYAETTAALTARNIPVRFRPHPAASQRRRLDKIRSAVLSRPGPSLADDLAGASCVVTFNSNTGVEASFAGVPTIATDIGSMAYEVASHSVAEMLRRPDRETWAARLAWKQWRREEMASGYCWETVGGGQ